MWRLAILMMLGTGCVAYDETVHVHLRDPALVAVSAPTPAGDRRLIEPGASTPADVPRALPPYLEEAQAGASVGRERGAIVAHCAWCAYDTERSVVRSGGELDLPGDTTKLRREGETLRMRYDYIAPLPCHRHHGLCERPAFALDLESPVSNVASIDYERDVSTKYGELTGARIGVVTGAILIAIGIATIGYFNIAGEATGSARWATAGFGTLAIGVGTAFTWFGVSTLRASDSDTPIPIP